MITAVDTSVLLDVFLPDPEFGEASEAALQKALADNELVICPEVYAELFPQFGDARKLNSALATLGVQVVATDIRVAEAAGRAWLKYRRAGGSRTRILTDFVVGGHALVCADRLLARDRGFYRASFEGLVVLSP